MDPSINIVKGIHPGIVLERELKKRGLSKGPFALSIQEFPQKILAITKGKRGMNTPFRLVGGTALSPQLGHRISVDIDLFTDAPYGMEGPGKFPTISQLYNL